MQTQDGQKFGGFLAERFKKMDGQTFWTGFWTTCTRLVKNLDRQNLFGLDGSTYQVEKSRRTKSRRSHYSQNS